MGDSVKFCAWSDTLMERSAWVPAMELAVISRAGQMPDAIIVELTDNVWQWWERGPDGEMELSIGGTWLNGKWCTPWEVSGVWGEASPS